MRHFALYRYRLPMQSGLVLRGQQQSCRQGLLCRLTEDGNIGWGEIAPLVGLSRETLPEALIQAQHCLATWKKGREYEEDVLFPSVAFGLSMAKWELQHPPSPLTPFPPVPLCSDSSTTTLARLQRENCTLAKLKVGRVSPQHDAENVKRLLATLPSLCLRLDANRAWNLQQAEEFAQSLTPQEKARIAFIEEPCQTPAQSLQFAHSQHIHIAWDESLQSAEIALTPQKGVSAIIIKPTLIGSREKCLALIQQAHRFGMDAVFSASIESSLGLTQLAQLAQRFTPNTPAGLDTLSLMQHQLIRPFPQSSLPLLDVHCAYVEQIP